MQLTLIGTTFATTSMALALKEATSEIHIVGHDPDPLLVARAKRLKAIDQSHWNLPAACEDADMLLIDVNLSELGPTLEAVSQDLKQDVVIIALSAVPSVALEAARVLPATVSFIAALPISAALAFPEYLEPSADWLAGIPLFLAMSPGVAPEAVDRAATLVSALGAEPRFADAVEMDGLSGVGEQLPLILALSLAAQFQGVPGERDRLGAAGGQLALLGAALECDPARVAGDWTANRAVLVAAIEACSQELDAIKQRIASGDESSLTTALEQAARTGRVWMTGEAEDTKDSLTTRPAGWLRALFLGGMLGRRRDDRD